MRRIVLAVLALALMAPPALADQTVTIKDEHGAGLKAPALAVMSVSCTWDNGHFVAAHGELVNLGTAALSGEQPQLTVRDGDGRRIGHGTGYADVRSLAPKQRSHFDVAARLADKDDAPATCQLDFLDSNSSALAWRDEALGG